ncbi:hypothetical protein [Fictibacillus enclensis]|uniref:hypothetical protein n=1 Tax=Fictibacillus enclensis TaxID=1017270 RepID=UPI0025A1A1C1|nr:hypothetical protein [Fictibacillus enclensis]
MSEAPLSKQDTLEKNAILLFLTLILEQKGKKNMNMNHTDQHITDEENAIREGALHQVKRPTTN